MNNEIIRKARRANLAEFLQGAGVPLVKCGRRHRHKEHNSLIITENSYFWNSRHEHGNAIDYLVRHMNYGFIEAVLALVPHSELSPQIAPSKVFDMAQIELNDNLHKIREYLHKSRQISNDLIEFLIRQKLLAQERQTNNIIFPMFDECGNCVGAEVHGVTPKRFKGVKMGSKYGCGFNLRFPDSGGYDYALFFESAIDLLSFVDFKRNHEKKTLNRCILVSMAGLKINVIKHTLGVFGGDLRVVLCVDNDEAGQSLKTAVKQAEIPYIDRSPNPKFKDWNDQLKDCKLHNKPIQRLMKRGGSGKYKPFLHGDDEFTQLTL